MFFNPLCLLKFGNSIVISFFNKLINSYIMKYLFFLFIIFVFSYSTYAQTQEQINEWVGKGNKASLQKNYQEGIHFYGMAKDAYEKKQIKDVNYGYILFCLSTDYFFLNDYSMAAEYGEKAVDLLKTLGDSHPDYILSLDYLVKYYYNLKDYSKAIEYETKVAEIYKATLGEDAPDYATSLCILSKFYAAEDDYSKAVEYTTKALEIRKKLYGESHSDYISLLGDLAIYYAGMGEPSKAEAFLKKYQACEITPSDYDPDNYKSISNHAYNYYLQGDYSKAIEYGIKAVDIILSTLGENNSDYVTAVHNLADYYSAYGDYSQAVVYGKKDMELSRIIYGENDSEYATALNNLSNSYANLGDYSKAIDYVTKALEIYKTAYGEEYPDYATSLSNLSSYYFDLGDYSKSLEYSAKVVKLRKETLGENDIDYAKALDNLACCYYYLGDYPKAIEIGNKASDIIREEFGEDNYNYAITLDNLANFYSDYGDHIKAIELCNKASDIFKEELGENNAHYTKALNNLALHYSNFGDYSKAIELSEKALKINKNIIDISHSEYSRSLNNLASYYSAYGNYSKAIELGVEALEIREKTFGENHPVYASSMCNNADYYFHLGEYSKTVDYFNKALDIICSNILHQFSCLTNYQRALYWGKNSFLFTEVNPFYSFKSFLKSTPNIYDKSALFAKGLLLTTEMEMNRLILESGDDVAMRMYEELLSQRKQLQKLYETPITERFLNTDSLSQESDNLEKKLIERSKVYGDFTKKLRTTWKDVQSALNDDEIAVEFLSFDVLGSDSTMVAALTVRKDDSEPKFIPLFELNQLKGVDDTEHFICPEVSNLVWDPLQKELQGIRRIYFSPAGVLHKIGIEYLPGMETYDMYRLSTTREIIEMKSKTIPIQKDQVMAVLYGGVNYEASNSLSSDTSSEVMPDIISDNVSRQLAISRHRAFVDSLDLRGMKADYLPSTLTEVQNISSSLEKANHPAVVHIGADATETSVKSLSTHNPTILHISTHGFYYSEKKARKADRPRFLSIEDERGANIEDKALTRSGLLMAGANLSLKGENVPLDVDDGILTAQEISRLDLRGTDLVVLSACETGRGDIMQGEGVFGLQRGFKKAGVQTILMSLWKVSDSATEMLMTEFYRNLCEGKSKRESLRLAQKFVKEYKSSDGTYSFNDPHYWAGFVVLD